MRHDEDQGLIVYQVKWAASPPPKPIAWLNAAILRERTNIERLVSEGAQSYILMTSVSGTAVPNRGTMDKLRTELERYSSELGIHIECWWRADLDALIDAAPDSLKWSYGDMLAGWDLIRYLNRSETLAEQDRVLRDLVRQVIATQWEEDARVKFKQVDLVSSALGDLFVDVEAVRIAAPGSSARGKDRRVPHELGGAAAYLLKADYNQTLVFGAPGQGKSTLGQFLCQVHRAAFLDNASLFPAPPGVAGVTTPRLPLRVDLRDYASWLAGVDPFAVAARDYLTPAERQPDPSLEAFLVRLARAKSGALPVTAETLQRIFTRFPLLLVLDGLDEVAEPGERQLVVAQINDFCARIRAGVQPAQVIVTTRPNVVQLAEPSSASFESISLQPLSTQLRSTYLGLWSRAQGLVDRDRETLRRIFEVRAVEPHIAGLAENPMQMTILLFLILKRGESVPHARTELYSSYMQTFLDREAEKSIAVRRHRADLEEVTAHLGWVLQEQSEAGEVYGRLSVTMIKRVILSYLYSVGKDVTLVDELFTAVTYRVWALSSKQQGTFQFDILPMQEYFAAKHLYEVAGAGTRDFDKTLVFRQLVRRPYWMNTCRFYAGFATVSELIVLAEVLKDEFELEHRPAHLRLITWTLLADGVFSRRPRTQNEVVELLASNASAIILCHLDGRQDGLPLLAVEHGGEQLLGRLCALIAKYPSAGVSRARVRLIRCLGPTSLAFIEWWASQIFAAAGGDAETAWLHLTVAGPDIPEKAWSEDLIHRLSLADPAAADVALTTSVPIGEDSPLESLLVAHVLDGQCSGISSHGVGFPRELLRIFGPKGFIASAKQGEGLRHADPTRRVGFSTTRSRDLPALERLVSRDDRFGEAALAMLTGKGQQHTTSPWANTARALTAIFGPCWLAAEIAVIGAASAPEVLKTGGDITPGSDPLGPAADYGRLLTEIRANTAKNTWWMDQFHRYPDPLSRCTWSLALVAVAAPAVVLRCLDLLETAVAEAPPERRRALLFSSSNLGRSRVARRLELAALGGVHRRSPDVLLLLSHYAVESAGLDPLPGLPFEPLTAMASRGRVGWPGVHALVARLLGTPSEQAVEALKDCPAETDLLSTVEGLEIPLEHARRIFKEPTRFPASVVVLAEKMLTGAAREESIRGTASDEGWFRE
ncbi:hypothetical protein FNH05_02000 [Amycolatopsis rhizosphaerae]|uniref:NACHT domain-containing protein n=1 Tax=Amycolatopsis rhizosphaerae TaxID=2053003 RepID=A0A558DLL5_9PSEU|nr:hypothetical protein [Amycolatopsis rhizosphaerae]TVT61916.1 hypothetical protein FNH05_02000 [Amycolatopsis rhizosphaerae]